MEQVNLNLYNVYPDAEMDRKVHYLIDENDSLNSQVNDLQMTHQVELENEYPYEPFFADVVELQG